jgi:hypothetical protein
MMRSSARFALTGLFYMTLLYLDVKQQAVMSSGPWKCLLLIGDIFYILYSTDYRVGQFNPSYTVNVAWVSPTIS